MTWQKFVLPWLHFILTLSVPSSEERDFSGPFPQPHVAALLVAHDPPAFDPSSPLESHCLYNKFLIDGKVERSGDVATLSCVCVCVSALDTHVPTHVKDIRS